MVWLKLLLISAVKCLSEPIRYDCINSLHTSKLFVMKVNYLFPLLIFFFLQTAIAGMNVREFVEPDFGKIPKNSFGESVRRGKEFLEHTYQKLPQYSGAQLNCTNCHLNSGTTPGAGPWIGITARFPQYRDRSGKIDALSDRINDCFERSLNGKRLPENSAEMKDIQNYMSWLSIGFKKGEDVKGSGIAKLKLSLPPDLTNGKKVFLKSCTTCHQANGQGLYEKGLQVYPSLWGEKSFNIGAGMARLHTAAGFVKHNMPLGEEETLSDKEAWDVAGYFTTQPRPDFKKKNKDWPKGNKPEDVRY